MLHHIPAPHGISFPAWAAVLGVLAVLILAALTGRLIRDHLARLAVCLVIGASAAFGVTGWADGQRHAALAAAAHAGHGHAVSVTGSLAAAFTVITIAVAAIALAVSAIAGSRRRGPGRRHRGQYGRGGRAEYGRQYAPSRRGW